MQKYTIQDVEAAFERSVNQICKAMEVFPFDDEAVYAQWLGQTYYTVRHTTRFLTLSAGMMDVYHEDFHQFYLGHLREEAGHEMLAYRDFENLGWKIEDIPETIEAQLMIQSQYHFLNKTPLAHVGFFWCLEMLSVAIGKGVLERVRKAHGPECVSFIELHVQEDVGHVRNITARVEKIPASDYEDLIRNIEQTGHLYTTMLKKLTVNYAQNTKAA